VNVIRPQQRIETGIEIEWRREVFLPTEAAAGERSGLARTEPFTSTCAFFSFISAIYQKRNVRPVENCKLFLVAPWTGMAPTEPEL
jgi:hypothetical protein